MTRIATFADGFSSASPPSIQGGVQEDYTIENNISVLDDIFTIDSSEYMSAFINFELKRSDDMNDYIQVGKIILSYDGSSWLYNLGAYQGEDMIILEDSISNPKDVFFQIDTSMGVGTFKYKSGSMGSSYSGSLKIFITRISVA